MCVYVHIYIYVCLCIHVYMHMHIYIAYIYTHRSVKYVYNYIHTNTQGIKGSKKAPQVSVAHELRFSVASRDDSHLSHQSLGSQGNPIRTIRD